MQGRKGASQIDNGSRGERTARRETNGLVHGSRTPHRTRVAAGNLRLNESQKESTCDGRSSGAESEVGTMIEKGGGCRRGRRALTALQGEWQRRRNSGRSQQGSEI